MFGYRRILVIERSVGRRCLEISQLSVFIVGKSNTNLTKWFKINTTFINIRKSELRETERVEINKTNIKFINLRKSELSETERVEINKINIKFIN